MNNKRLILLLFITISLSFSSCRATPTPIAEFTPLPSSDFQVISIKEDDIATSELEQSKVFNQCASNSALQAEISFSQVSGQETQQELILGGEGGGEIGVSEVAKVIIKGKIEQHYANSQSSSKGHEETVKIEVPAKTKQEYTIFWGENWRKGIVEYKEDGETKTVDYSYRIGVELLSTVVKDIKCPNNGIPEKTDPPNIASETASVTTVEPVENVSRDTLSGSILRKGESWTSKGVTLTLEKVEWSKDVAWGGVIDFWIYMKNNTGSELLVSYDKHNFYVQDNNGNEFSGKCFDAYSYSYVVGSGEGRYISDACTPYDSVMFAGNFFNLSVTQITLRIVSLSRIAEAQWIVDVPH